MNIQIVMARCALLWAVGAVAEGGVRAETVTVEAVDTSLDDVVVVANRMPEPLSKIGASVTVLSADTLQQSQAVLASDLLARTPGINIARNGSVGSPTSVFIRGAESTQTVVRIDGVLLNDPSTTGGGFDFANLLTGGMSRVEILRGAQSTLYGSQAIGGVIDITTADPAGPFGGGVTVEGGSHGTGYVTANVGGREDGLMWRLSGNYLGTSGIPSFDAAYGGARRDAGQIGGGSGQVRYDVTPQLQIDLRGYYAQARTDFDGYDTPTGAFGDDSEYARTAQTLGYAGLNYTSPEQAVTQRLAFEYTDAQTRNYDPKVIGPSTETYYGIGRNLREEYVGTWAITPRYQLVFGAQHERSTIDTDTPAYDVLPTPLDKAVSIDSGYAQLQATVLEGLTLTAGGRYDRHDVYGGHATGQAAAAWALDDGRTILRASFGQGFKAPSLYQLYSNYGNQALRPEQANSWDAGVERQAWDGRVVLSATYFERRSHSLINFFDCSTPSPLCATEPFGYYANIARALARGVELQATVTPLTDLSLAANATYTATRDESPGAATYGNQLPRRPAAMANVSATYRWPVRLCTELAARYSGRAFDDAANEISLGGYVLVDLRVSYALLDRLDVYARVENLGGKRYETAYQYGTLGRVAYAGARFTF